MAGQDTFLEVEIERYESRGRCRTMSDDGVAYSSYVWARPSTDKEVDLESLTSTSTTDDAATNLSSGVCDSRPSTSSRSDAESATDGDEHRSCAVSMLHQIADDVSEAFVSDCDQDFARPLPEHATWVPAAPGQWMQPVVYQMVMMGVPEKQPAAPPPCQYQTPSKRRAGKRTGAPATNAAGFVPMVFVPEIPGAPATAVVGLSQYDDRTTVMLRNLPEKFSRSQLTDLLDAMGFWGRYDFVYVPRDFTHQGCLGYAFVNMVGHEDAEELQRRLQGFRGWRVPSRKVCEAAWGDQLQGLAAHVERYRNGPMMHRETPDEFKPAIFEGGVRVAFPAPTKRVRPMRCAGRKGLKQGYGGRDERHPHEAGPVCEENWA